MKGPIVRAYSDPRHHLRRLGRQDRERRQGKERKEKEKEEVQKVMLQSRNIECIDPFFESSHLKKEHIAIPTKCIIREMYIRDGPTN